ncbi:MAG: hypothetical protein JXL84_20045 [Deltaproteobacteria bacterium]|nr:hypothetical protein [Deltaproteobacteria bacterium]
MKDPAYDDTRKRIRQLQQEVLDQRRNLLQQEDLEGQLIQAQKMESLANLAAGMAHDFNNILQSILGLTQLGMYRRTEDVQNLEVFLQIEKIIERGRELTEQFLTLGRKKLPAFAPLDLNRRVRDTARFLRRTIPGMIEIELRLEQEIREILADEGQIEKVLMHLGLNAMDAMAQGGTLAFKTDRVRLESNHPLLDPTARPGDYVCLSVSDLGCGIPPEHMKRIYDPFFTTKKGGKGTGLGLSMVYAIVKNHGGLLHCSSRVGEGTTFSMYFPALSDTRIQTPLLSRASAPFRACGSGNQTVQLVEDDREIPQPTSQCRPSAATKVTSDK